MGDAGACSQPVCNDGIGRGGVAANTDGISVDARVRLQVERSSAASAKLGNFSGSTKCRCVLKDDVSGTTRVEKESLIVGSCPRPGINRERVDARECISPSQVKPTRARLEDLPSGGAVREVSG